jgi:hypothetical protein
MIPPPQPTPHSLPPIPTHTHFSDSGHLLISGLEDQVFFIHDYLFLLHILFFLEEAFFKSEIQKSIQNISAGLT